MNLELTADQAELLEHAIAREIDQHRMAQLICRDSPLTAHLAVEHVRREAHLRALFRQLVATRVAA